VDKIEAFIGRLSPEPVCDACVAERLFVPETEVQACAHGLAGTRGYKRDAASCVLCATQQITTRLVKK
jgi:hypothetical protein